MTTDPRAQFRRDGVTFLPGALDSATVRAAESCWQRSIETPGRFATRLLPDRMEPVSSVNEAREQAADASGCSYQEYLGPAASAEAYNEVITSTAVTDILRSLFSSDEQGPEAWFFGAQVFLKEGDEVGTGWHQDSPDMGAEGQDLVTLWMSFDPLPADASLEMVRGSHEGPTYDSYYGAYRSEPIPDVEGDRSAFDIVSYACSPGDVVAFHPAVLHGGAPTRAGMRRRSLALRFFGQDSRLAPAPHRDPDAVGRPFRNPIFSKIL